MHIDSKICFVFNSDECNGTSGSWGVTIGSYINMSIPGRINNDFKDYFGSSQLFMHEYGHSLQSQMIGLSYLLVIGLPSLISASVSKPIYNDPIRAPSHERFITEVWANIWADRYFSKYYDYDWQENWGGLCYPLDWNY